MLFFHILKFACTYNCCCDVPAFTVFVLGGNREQPGIGVIGVREPPTSVSRQFVLGGLLVTPNPPFQFFLSGGVAKRNSLASDRLAMAACFPPNLKKG